MPIPPPDPFTAPSTLTARDDVYPYIASENFSGTLRGRNAAITGAGRGLGKAAAFAFAAAGANVACIARRQADIDAVAEEIQKTHGVKAIAVAGDVSKAEDHGRLVEEINAKLGPIDALVNCAGVTRFSPFTYEQDMTTWWKVVQINLFGVAGMTHAVLPDMIKRGAGAIINVTSTGGSLNLPFMSAYSTSKAAVIKFTQELHEEVGERGIRLFSVHPGSVQTDLASSAEAINAPQEALQEYPKLGKLFQDFQGMQYQTPQLAAQTFVALAERKDAACLGGLYIDSQTDLEEMIKEASKAGRGKVGKENLYKLKMEEL